MEKKEWIKGEYKDALIFVLWNLFGSLTPLWLGGIILMAFQRWEGFHYFFAHGEFYLYSAALFTPTIYLYFRNKRSNHDIFAYLLYVSVFGLLVSGVLYTGLLTGNDIYKNAEPKFDPHFLQCSSLILFVIAIPLSYISQALDYKAPNLQEAQKNDLKNLESNFDNLNK